MDWPDETQQPARGAVVLIPAGEFLKDEIVWQ